MQKGPKELDKLGMTEAELKLFRHAPKAYKRVSHIVYHLCQHYHQLGAYDKVRGAFSDPKSQAMEQQEALVRAREMANESPPALPGGHDRES